MTAPVFILTAATLEPAGADAAAPGVQLVLTGPEARHAVSVRRLRAGERVDLVDGHGLRLECEVSAVQGRDRLEVSLIRRVSEPEPPLRLALIQALAKGGRDEQAVETATEVGVDLIVPWQAGRSISVWSGPKLVKGRERWATTAREAAKQARRAVVPHVEAPRSTRELTQWIELTCRGGGVVGLLHEEAEAPLVSLPEPAPTGAGDGAAVLAVIVGPEGGIGGEEAAALVEAGARMVRLGPHVMRTASAGPVALAVLAQRAGLWS
ncbi:16S rRNA (uracil(1498)-N(3))-methyltransferase [Actinomyces slackii]|uniref:Ribosomal RNA small subunit methyltransferase E n=1 Tax=Actinomyces slackii TaxID=52774 RepID=A0A3S4STZ1_9ACTO|nr:16S rRNA (uracil(1498)-N(3))-methyltransferase [Actinomyces slackii]VEG74999.1 Ribosomal RNA small subunit methyltransferase E [Actinomyces slackii]